MRMKVECSFEEASWSIYLDKFYKCKISNNKEIPEENDVEFIGNHLDGKTNNDLTFIHFFNCNMAKLPQGLSNCFPNLKIISIFNSKLKAITKNDLSSHKQLKIFSCSCNKIEFLPGNLFDDSKGIEWISFYDNDNLKVIEPNLLDNLHNLKYFGIKNSPNYDIEFSVFPNEKTNTTLQDVKNHFAEVFFFDWNFKALKDFFLRFDDPIEELKKFMTVIKKDAKILKMSVLKSELIESLKKDEFQELRNSIQILNDECKELRMCMQNFSDENKQLKICVQNLSDECIQLRLCVQNLNTEIQNLGLNFRHEMDNLKNQIQKDLIGDLRRFMQNENIKDFKIIINDREFPVHKFLLAARSPTLAETFSKNPGADSLKLIDISVEIFEKILKFLYTDELPCEDGTNFVHLFAASGRLQIAQLMELAEEKILSQIDTLNVLEVFYLANKYGHEELIQKSFHGVKKKYTKIDFHDEWATDPEKVSKVIEALRKKEEMIKQIENEFENLIMESKKL